jgi:hypothetical protein
VRLSEDGVELGQRSELARGANAPFYVHVGDDGVQAIVTWWGIDDLVFRSARVSYSGDVVDYGGVAIETSSASSIAERRIASGADGSFLVLEATEVAEPPDRGHQLYTWSVRLEGAGIGPDGPDGTSGCGCQQSKEPPASVFVLLGMLLMRRRRR